jgi:hypothetical protein
MLHVANYPIRKIRKKLDNYLSVVIIILMEDIMSNIIDLAAYKKLKYPVKENPQVNPAIQAAAKFEQAIGRLEKTQAFLIVALERLNKAQNILAFVKTECERIEQESEMVQNAIFSGDIGEMERVKAELLNRHGIRK